MYERSVSDENDDENFSLSDITQSKKVMMMLGYKGREMDYVVDAIVRLSPTELDQAVILLPEQWICRVAEALISVIENEKKYSIREVILAGRAMFTVTRIHYKNLTAKGVLNQKVAMKLRAVFEKEKRMYQWNLEGLNLLHRQMIRKNNIKEFKEVKFGNNKKGGKKKKNDDAPILTVI